MCGPPTGAGVQCGSPVTVALEVLWLCHSDWISMRNSFFFFPFSYVHDYHTLVNVLQEFTIDNFQI